jgi:hypothetical protein
VLFCLFKIEHKKCEVSTLDNKVKCEADGYLEEMKRVMVTNDLGDISQIHK